MSYTPPSNVQTKTEAVLALASTIADEDKSALGNGSVNKALDVLADVLAEQDVQVPQTDAGAILALAQYVTGGGGGGSSDFTTAHVTATGTNFSISDGIFNVCTYMEDGGISASSPRSIGSGHSIEFDVILYKGAAALMTDPENITATSGAIQQMDEGVYLITGDCSITTA